MPVYVLRHERRSSDASYNSGLTATGLSYSIQLADRLEKLNITKIYCSPFIRAIQTVHPYATKFNIPIQVDYALIEFIYYSQRTPPRPSYLSHPFKIQMTDDERSYWNISQTYISSHSFGEILNETEENLNNRISKFVSYLRQANPEPENGNILIVSHQTPIKCLMKTVNNSTRMLNMGEIDKLW